MELSYVKKVIRLLENSDVDEVEIEDEMNVRPVRTWVDLAIKVADKTIDIGFKLLEILVLGKIAGSGKKK